MIKLTHLRRLANGTQVAFSTAGYDCATDMCMMLGSKGDRLPRIPFSDTAEPLVRIAATRRLRHRGTMTSGPTLPLRATAQRSVMCGRHIFDLAYVSFAAEAMGTKTFDYGIVRLPEGEGLLLRHEDSFALVMPRRSHLGRSRQLFRRTS